MPSRPGLGSVAAGASTAAGAAAAAQEEVEHIECRPGGVCAREGVRMR